MEQIDLFGAPIAAMPPPAVLFAAPPSDAIVPAASPVAGGRDWARGRIIAWSRRAAEMRARGGPGDALRANALDQVVAGLRARWPDAGAAADDGRLAKLKARLADWQPRYSEKLGVMLNVGKFGDEIRAQLQADIDALEGRG